MTQAKKKSDLNFLYVSGEPVFLLIPEINSNPGAVCILTASLLVHRLLC